MDFLLGDIFHCHLKRVLREMKTQKYFTLFFLVACKACFINAANCSSVQCFLLVMWLLQTKVQKSGRSVCVHSVVLISNVWLFVLYLFFYQLESVLWSTFFVTCCYTHIYRLALQDFVKCSNSLQEPCCVCVGASELGMLFALQSLYNFSWLNFSRESAQQTRS